MRGYAKEIEEYEKKQAQLRQQLRRLKSRKIGVGIEADTPATIQRIGRQIADLDRAIARLREKGVV